MALKILEIIKHPSIIEWDPMRSSILIGILIIVGGIGIFIKSLFVKYLVHKAPANRPINSFILREQTLRLIASLTMIFGNMTSLSQGKSLYDLYGHPGCFVFRQGVIIGVFVGYVSGFSMALLRYIMIVHPAKLQKLGIDKAKRFVNITELAIYMWLGLWSLMAYFYTSSPFNNTFCYDRSVTFLNTLIDHNIPARGTLEKKSQIILAFCLALLGIIELVMYIRIFKSLRKKDEFMKKSIGMEMFLMRTKRNIISLSGQVFSFALEMIMMIIAYVLTPNNSTSPFFLPQMTSFNLIILSTILSIGQFMSSPDMRQYYLKFDF